jgi:hypothetical protein
MKRFFFLLGVFFLSFQRGYAEGVSLIPPKFEFSADPGDVINNTIVLINMGESSILYSSHTEDFVAGGETGVPQFVSHGDDELSLANWITVNNGEDILLPPNERVSIPFTITLPENAEPGGKYGSIFFAPPVTPGQVGIRQRIGSLVLVRVSGDIKEEGKVVEFNSYHPEENTPQQWFLKSPVRFVLRYENTGNVHVQPTGKIVIKNMFGNPVKNIGVQSSIHKDRGDIVQEIVDFLPVNDGKGNVLRESIRRFEVDFLGNLSWAFSETGQKETKIDSLPLGYYSAELELTGAKDEKYTQTISFIVFPIFTVLLYSFIILLLIFVGYKYKKYSYRKMKEKIMKEMQQ